MGHRFWLTLAVSVEAAPVRYDEGEQVALVEIDRRFLAVATADAPIQVTAHDSIEALRADFEQNGYFYTATRGDQAPVIALRFNMEMMRSGAYGLALPTVPRLRSRRRGRRLPSVPPISRHCSAGASKALSTPCATSSAGTRSGIRSTTASIRR